MQFLARGEIKVPVKFRIRKKPMKKNLKKLAIVIGVGLGTISLQAATLLSESFSYADGDIVPVSSPLWNYHSGGGTPATALNVVSGQAFINQNDNTGSMGDANRLLSSVLNPTNDNTTVVYSSFSVNFTALPFNTGTNISGSYFAHFRANSGSEFYSRIGATTVGAAPGSFRINVGNEAGFSSANPISFPMDLSLNTTYTVVTRLSFATDQTTLWINPVLESDPSATAVDGITYAGQITGYALRQGTSGGGANIGAPGEMYLDNLIVATSFSEVVPEPTSLALVAIGAGAALLRRRKA